jgi:hypothetical protein
VGELAGANKEAVIDNTNPEKKHQPMGALVKSSSPRKKVQLVRINRRPLAIRETLAQGTGSMY